MQGEPASILVLLSLFKQTTPLILNNSLANSNCKVKTATTMSKNFKSGLFGCCDSGCMSCMSVWCCPCCAAGEIGAQVDQSYPLCCCGVMCFGCIPLCPLRGTVRAKRDIQGDACTDLLVVCCCPSCALTQMNNEMKAMKNAPQAAAMDRGPSQPVVVQVVMQK